MGQVCALGITGERKGGRGGRGGKRWGKTHQPLSLRDRLVRSEFLAALSSAFANRRQTWGEVVGCGEAGMLSPLCLGKGRG